MEPTYVTFLSENEAFKKHWKRCNTDNCFNLSDTGDRQSGSFQTADRPPVAWPSWWEREHSAVLDKLGNKEVYSGPPNSDTLLTGKNAKQETEKHHFQQSRVYLDQRPASQS